MNKDPVDDSQVKEFSSSFSTRDVDENLMRKKADFNKYQFLVSDSCVTKGVMSFVGGFGMGVLWGSLSSPAELSNPYSPMGSVDPGSMTFKQVFKATRERCVSYGKSFAVLGLMFATFDCTIEKYRGKHDKVNSLAAGCLTGGALSARFGYKAAAGGCAGFAAFSFIIDSIMGTH
ncbi:mitochondrial import inner membrane translocase subunit Tim22 [Acrasis kona]|uniref:Mitochondrial import inner membrane translocase subunit TIM22 n=1 Tax=Acrasis kona TaxID=1008807 RepID=A0AAW2YX01_9EUKA